jgi:hypothetical protein
MNFHIRYCRDCAARANKEKSATTMRVVNKKAKKTK